MRRVNSLRHIGLKWYRATAQGKPPQNIHAKDYASARRELAKIISHSSGTLPPLHRWKLRLQRRV